MSINVTVDESLSHVVTSMPLSDVFTEIIT